MLFLLFPVSSFLILMIYVCCFSFCHFHFDGPTTMEAARAREGTRTPRGYPHDKETAPVKQKLSPI